MHLNSYLQVFINDLYNDCIKLFTDYVRFFIYENNTGLNHYLQAFINDLNSEIIPCFRAQFEVPFSFFQSFRAFPVLAHFVPYQSTI